MRKPFAIYATLVVVAAVIILTLKAQYQKKPVAGSVLENRTAARDSGQTPGKTPSTINAGDNQSNVTTTGAGPRELLGALKKAIADGDWQKSKTLCEQLAQAGAEAFKLLIKILADNESMDEKDIELRWRAAYILGEMKDKKVIPIFDGVLNTEKAEKVRNMIVLGLGKLKDDAAAPILQRLLLDENEGKTARKSSAMYLAKLQTGVNMLIDIAQSIENDKEMRLWAVESLSAAKGDAMSSTALLEILGTDADARLRTSAAGAIGKIGNPESVKSLMSSLKDDSDFRVRAACAGALSNFKDNETVKNVLVEALLNDRDPRVRGNAAKTIGSLGSKNAVADFKELLRTEQDRVVRVRIAEALGKIGGEESKTLLDDLSKNDPSVHVRKAAEAALKSTQD